MQLINKTPLRAILQITLLFIVLTASNACKKTTPEPEPIPVEEDACLKIGFSSEQGNPLQRITIQNLPTAYQTGLSVLEIWVEGEDTNTFVPVEIEGNAHSFTVPIHPIRPLEGGTVDLVLVNEELSCDPISFSISGLPKAPPNTAKTTIDNLQSMANTLRAAAGTDKATLSAANFETLTPFEQNLKILQDFLDEPTNPYSLEKIMAGEADLVSAADLNQTMEITDAIFMYTGFSAATAEALEEMQASIGGKKQASAEFCFTFPSNITNAEELSCTMTFSNSRAMSLDKDAPFWSSLNEAGNMANTVGLFPPLSAPALVVGVGAFAAQSAVQAVHKCLPSSFEDLEYTVEKRSWLEDEDKIEKWKDVKVIATSKGWEMDKFVIDLMLNFLNIQGVASSAISNAKKAKDLYLQKQQKVIELLPSSDDLSLFAYGHFMNDIFGKYGKNSPDLIRIPPEKTKWIDINDTDYHSALAEGDAFQLDVLQQTIKPIKAGTSILTVRPIASKFGGQTIEKGKANLEVIPIDVSTDRMLIPISKAGETLTLNGFIENAIDNSLEWETTAGELTFLEFEDTELGHEVYELKTSSDPEDYPILVTIESTSTTGARNPAYSPFPRRTSINISLSDLELSIDGETCLKPGESTNIVATMTGADNPAVIWTVDPDATLITSSLGDVNTANFTAPDEEGSYKITATSVENPALEKSVRIRVRKSCDNYIILTVDGETVESHPNITPSIISQFAICSENNTGETNCLFTANTPIPWIDEEGDFGTIPIDLSWRKSGMGNVSPTGTHSLSVNSDDEITGGVIKIGSIPILNGGAIGPIRSTSATLIVHKFDKSEKILVADFSGNFEGRSVQCTINIE